MHALTAAAIQVSAGSDKHANADKAEAFVRDAARHGAQLIVLPEVFAWRGPQAAEPSIAEPVPGPLSSRFAAVARALRVWLVLGSIHESASPTHVYNTSLVLSPDGEITATYRKLHLFDIDLPGRVTVRESDVRRPGDRPVTAATPFGPLGLSICYDLRFPELYRALSSQGTRVFAVPSAFTFTTGAAHWEVLLRARAIENQAFVIAANQIGAGAEGIQNYGNSMIIDPWGTPLARAADREGIIYAELDFEHQDRIRRELPSLQHRRL